MLRLSQVLHCATHLRRPLLSTPNGRTPPWLHPLLAATPARTLLLAAAAGGGPAQHANQLPRLQKPYPAAASRLPRSARGRARA